MGEAASAPRSGTRFFFQAHPLHPFSEWVAAVGGRGVARGVVNLGLLRRVNDRLLAALERRLRSFDAASSSPWALRVPLDVLSHLLPLISELGRGGLDSLILSPSVTDHLPEDGLLGRCADGLRGRPELDVWVEVRSRQEMEALSPLASRSWILVGRDASLMTSASSAFSLMQQLRGAAREERFMARGGLGPTAIRALLLAGAEGVVLEGEFAGLEAFGLSSDGRARLGRLRPRAHRSIPWGTGCLQLPLLGTGDDVLRARRSLEDLSRALEGLLLRGDRPSGELEFLSSGREAGLPAAVWQGQASPDGIVEHVLASLPALRRSLSEDWPWKAGKGVAESLGSKLPIVQGPMAWISDRPAFARAVWKAGALPVLAFGGKSPEACRRLMAGSDGELPERWAAGLIGFEGAKIFEEQLQALGEHAPVMAVLAGATAPQCRRLRDAGIPPFAHAPAPELFSLFHDENCDLILEGWESGGHVGAYSSLMLWEACLARLSPRPPEERATRRLLLAGGIGDGFGAFVAACFAQAFRQRGYVMGLQLGTAYLATTEALESGALTPLYRRLLREGRQTHVIGEELGHAVRLLDGPLTTQLRAIEAETRRKGLGKELLGQRMAEVLKGRLRLAAQGVLEEGATIRVVDEARQAEEAGFMAGQIASGPGLAETMEGLHRELCEGLVAEEVSVLGPLDCPRSRGRIFLLAGDGHEELAARVEALSDELETRPENFHALRRRSILEFSAGEHGAMVLAESGKDCIDRLGEVKEHLRQGGKTRIAPSWAHVASGGPRKLFFLYPGQGASYEGMLGEGAASHLHLRALMEEERLRWYRRGGFDPFEGAVSKDPLHVQAGLVAVEGCLDAYLSEFGICPDGRGGHSLGELAALDGLRRWPRDFGIDLVLARGQSMTDLPVAGGLTAVQADGADLGVWLELLGRELQLVNFNGPKQTVVAGSIEDLQELERFLAAHSVGFRRLEVTHPFHGSAMRPVAEAFGKRIEGLLAGLNDGDLGALRSRAAWDQVWSNLTGASYGEAFGAWSEERVPEQARALRLTLKSMLTRHVDQPVRFREMIQNMLDGATKGSKGHRSLLVELGPGRTLSRLVQDPRRSGTVFTLPSLLPGREGESLDHALAVCALWGRAPMISRVLRDEGELAPSLPGDAAAPPAAAAPQRWARVLEPHVPPPSEDDVAVVAVAIEVAGADGEDPFWELLLQGKDMAAPVPPSKWERELFTDADPDAMDRAYTDVAAVATFDTGNPVRFQVQPKAAAFIDRMQLVSLKLTERLLADVGWERGAFPHRDGMVCLGYGVNEAFIGRYAGRLVLENQKAQIRRRIGEEKLEGGPVEAFFDRWLEDQDGELPHFETIGVVGTLANMVTARVARWLDWDQPNFVVDSACSSSLAALDVAIQGLRSGRCRYAISGGMDDFSLGRQIGFSKAHALSKKGRCTPFDVEADGLIQGDGAALFLLTTVGQARKDGRRIRAVLRGLGGSSDGHQSSGITVPSVERQSLSLRRCLLDATWQGAHVDYVEAHGTGTNIGDPIEFRSLEAALGKDTGTIYVGSVKGNVGHTMVASAAVSLAKTVLCIERGTLPPTANLEHVHPKLASADHELVPLQRSEPFLRRAPRVPRRCVVCANGFGGTNYHLAVEEWMGDAPSTGDGKAMLCLAAADLGELRLRLQDLRAHGSTSPRRWADRWLAQGGIGSGPLRLSLFLGEEGGIDPDLDEMLRAFETIEGGAAPCRIGPSMVSRTRPDERLRPALLFPGFASAAPDSGALMSARCPAFAEIVDMRLGLPDPFVAKIREKHRRSASLLLGGEPGDRSEGARTDALVSAIFAACTLDLAYLRCVDLLGLNPVALAGYSLGELVALYGASVLDGEDFAILERDVVKQLGRLASTWEGWMSSVVLEDEVLAELLEGRAGRVGTAMRIAPGLHIVTGLGRAMEDFEKEARQRGGTLRRLDGAGAFHLGRGQEGVEALSPHASRRLRMGRPTLPVHSSVGGLCYDELADREAVLRHWRSVPLQAMELQRQIEALWQDGASCFIEVGAGGTYGHMARAALGDRKAACLSLGKRGQRDEWEAFRLAVAELHGLGLPLRGEAFTNLGLIPGPGQGGSAIVAAPRHGLGGSGRGAGMDDERMRALERVLQMNRELVERGLEANTRALASMYGEGDGPVPAEKGEGAGIALPRSPGMAGEGDVPERALPLAEAPSAKTAADAPKGKAPEGPGPVVDAPKVDGALRKTVLAIIEKHTGYGEEHLRNEARLDDDLAIDSIQQLLILNDITRFLGKEPDGDLDLESARGPETIGELLQLVQAIADAP